MSSDSRINEDLASIECVWPAGAILGEAPYWDAENEILYWVDIDGKKVFRYQPESGTEQIISLNNEIGCIIPRRSGGFVAGLDQGLAFLDTDISGTEFFAAPEDNVPDTRFNDGKCDRRGRFWVASADRNETEPLGALYCLNDSGTLTRILPGVIVGNGLGWSPDNRTMYFTDSGVSTIFAFDYEIETGTAQNQRAFAVVPEEHGFPDGLTVDAEGFVWSAHWNGARITRYTPDGDIDRVIHMPVPNPTSLAFGGTDLSLLFVTSARFGMNDQELEKAPMSGGLFVIEAGVKGLPEQVYAG